LAISNVAGTFKIFQGSVETENEDFNDATIHFEIDAGSLDTNNAERDKHLQSAAFFDTEKFPKIRFEGALHKVEDNFTLVGALTMLETTKNISFETECTGIGMGRFGDTRAGFEVQGKISRKDFGLAFNLLTETGSLVVGEEVKLHFDIQLIKQAVQP
jgi:polyisoprenoid-binding protein YceI